jgi:hypothetical protein
MATQNQIDLFPLDIRRRWRFDWVLGALFRPRQSFNQIANSAEGVWLTPIAILIVTALLHVLISGSIKHTAAQSGQIVYPPGYEWYSPEQQAQFQQALAATSGPLFVYVLPAVLAVIGVFAAWLVVGWLLHLVLTLFGGRGTGGQVLNVAAWAALPFALRHGVRILAMISSQQLISHPGLSGFAPPAGEAAGLYLAALLAMVDVYLIWSIVLLVAGVQISDRLPALKAATAVLVTVTALVLLKATPTLLTARLSDLTIIRPFF